MNRICNPNSALFGSRFSVVPYAGVLGYSLMLGPVGSQGLAYEIGRAMMHVQANMMIRTAFGQDPSAIRNLPRFLGVRIQINGICNSDH